MVYLSWFLRSSAKMVDVSAADFRCSFARIEDDIVFPLVTMFFTKQQRTISRIQGIHQAPSKLQTKRRSSGTVVVLRSSFRIRPTYRYMIGIYLRKWIQHSCWLKRFVVPVYFSLSAIRSLVSVSFVILIAFETGLRTTNEQRQKQIKYLHMYPTDRTIRHPSCSTPQSSIDLRKSSNNLQKWTKPGTMPECRNSKCPEGEEAKR